MARMGQFAGATEQYGGPVSYVHPKDNNFDLARFSPEVLDPRWKLTDAQKRKKQEEIDDLYYFLKMGADKVG